MRAYAHDLSVFFSVVKKDPLEVRPKDVMSFVTVQRRPKPWAENVVRIADGSAGLSAATIKRRLAAVSSFYGYLITRDDVDVTANPVPRGIATRQSRSRGGRGLPLVRGVRRLPRILDPEEIDALDGGAAHRARPCHDPGHGARGSAALRGPRPSPGRPAPRRVAAAHQRRQGRPRTIGAGLTHLLFDGGSLHGPRTSRRRRATRSSSRSKGHGAANRCRCRVCKQIIRDARLRVELSNGTCHELRHTCFTRLRGAGMAIEAIQALAGHRSITSTRVYLHLCQRPRRSPHRRP